MYGILVASDTADPLWHNAQRLGSACCADAFAGFRAAMIMRAAAAPRQKCKADYGSDQPAYLAALGHPDFGAFIRFGRFCPSLWRVARRCLCPVGLDFSLIAHSSRYDCSLIA